MHATHDYLPPRVYDGVQVAALDRRFIEQFGATSQALMQRAARAVYAELAEAWPMPGRMVIFAGPGNNGADAALIGEIAHAGGWNVRLVAPLGLDGISQAASVAFDRYRDAVGEVVGFDDIPVAGDLIIDGLFGIGVNREVTGDGARAIARINEAGARGTGVLSVDIPSGLDATTGRVHGAAVKATRTVTFIGLKLGLMSADGPAHSGNLAFHDLDAPDALYADQPYRARRIAHRDLRHVLPARARSAHKGDNGHVLCLGGDRGLGGAIRMTAEAALRSGAGLTSVVCHPDHAGAMSQARPELMCLGLAADDVDDTRLAALLGAASVIAIGPGLGAADDKTSPNFGDRLYDQAMAADVPLVVDADALNRLARAPQQRGNWILTPHPGEAARLLGCQTADILMDRVGAVRRLAERYDAIVVLKGAGSLVATPNEIWLCSQGNPGMAVGGMGDVLTGVIAALVAQGLTLANAAVAGAYVHALAGDTTADAIGERGMLPSDLISRLPGELNPVAR